MANLTPLGAWIEGETEAKDLVFKLADAIVSAKIPNHKITGEEYPNRWDKVFSSEGDMWVTYTKKTTSTTGKYTHTDGKTYTVYQIVRPSKSLSGLSLNDDDSYNLLEEAPDMYDKPVKSGETFLYGDITYTSLTGEKITRSVEGLLCVFVDDTSKKPKGYIIEQFRTTSANSIEQCTYWDEFRIVGELPNHFNDHYKNGALKLPLSYTRPSASYSLTYTNIIPEYIYDKLSYVADMTHIAQPCVLLCATPDASGDNLQEPMYVLLEQPATDYNHITIRYGKGCVVQTADGNPSKTYIGACDPHTVGYGKVPVIVSQSKAHEIYAEWNGVEEPPFVPYTLTWELDYDGETPLVSPLSRFYHGRNSTVSWVTNKKRRPDYIVEYYISVTNNRVMIILQGDPSPGINDYYRSFAYIGKINPFNNGDQEGNFGVTCGMGDLVDSMTGLTLKDISGEHNPDYAGWGEYTSNGMCSMSMFDTRSKVKYQAHYPAFLTHLPNYSDVGTIPPHLSKLILDNDGFQPSVWTDRYHASPIYMVHQAEGYRGSLDGVVAIHDHNLINLDELLVDTEIPKDEEDPTKGTYTEVYKFFSLKSPVNMFKYSPAPDVITVAIIKDIE